MTRDEAQATILAIYKARKVKDIASMVQHAHADATYRMNVGKPPLEMAGLPNNGLPSLAAAFTALRDEFLFDDDWTVKEFLHHNDTSVLLWHGTVTASSTGKHHHFNVATVVTWKDGKVNSITDNTDTIAVAEIVGRREGHKHYKAIFNFD